MQDVPDDYNFLRLGGRTFVIKEVAVPTVDAAVAVMQDVHRRRTEALTQQLRTEFVQEAFALAHQEHTAILREAERSSVSVPQAQYGLPLVVIDNKLCPVRSHLYAPNLVTGSLANWRRYVSSDYTTLWDSINAAIGARQITEPSSHVIRISGTPHYMTNMLCTFTGSRILLNMSSYHTTGTAAQSANRAVLWHKLCTGLTTAPDYWNMDIQVFRNGLNSINLDSVAHSDMMMNGNSVSIASIVNMLTNRNITHIPPAEGWGEAS